MNTLTQEWWVKSLHPPHLLLPLGVGEGVGGESLHPPPLPVPLGVGEGMGGVASSPLFLPLGMGAQPFPSFLP